MISYHLHDPILITILEAYTYSYANTVGSPFFQISIHIHNTNDYMIITYTTKKRRINLPKYAFYIEIYTYDDNF